MNIFLESLLYIIGVFILFILMSLLIGNLMLYSYQKSCESYQRYTDREIKIDTGYPFYVNCFVKTESGWIELEKIQLIETPNLLK